ncbi:MAG TPA: M28 family peptidase [Candidatus Thermoplasmatota archaeon]|nr:M28 family peptidase [Candidatus Thermoplasmatota archaeon]
MKLPAILLVVPLLAGCLAPGSPASTEPSPPASTTYAAQLAAGLPAIEWDVRAAIDWWEDISSAKYAKHDSNLPTNTLLRTHIVDEMRALGFMVEVRAYPGSAQGQPLPDNPATPLYAIVATKEGTASPAHRIGLVSHYDSNSLTINGAYDDMSGVAAEYSICKALAQVPMNKTLACIFFDGEERGLVASQRYVDDVVKGGKAGYVYDFVLGYDMTGINWPAKYMGQDWSMYVMVGENVVPELHGFAGDLFHGVLGYPEPGVTVLDRHDRNSDERRFKEAGIPILRLAGGRNAADYDQYHKPLDTVEHVYEVTGGRGEFEKGFATIVESSFPTILVLDRTDLTGLAAHAA